MKIYRIPQVTAAILFDIDSTLYENKAYAQHQEDVLVQALAAELGTTPEEARRRVDAVRNSMTSESGGRKPSLANTFRRFGVDIPTSVKWRERYIMPEQFLGPDPALIESLDELASRFRLGCLTNNPAVIGRRTLEVIGVARHMDFVVGLDDTLASKPDPAAFRAACDRWAGKALAVSPESILSVGDRVPVDIEPALALGMGAVLVEGIADLYATGPLHQVLS